MAKAAPARGKQQDEEKEPFVHPENRGSAFRNDKKSKDTDPEYMGTANIGGELFRVVIWANDFKGDEQGRLALLFETEEEYQEKKAARESESSGSRGGSSKGRNGGSTRRVSRNRNY